MGKLGWTEYEYYTCSPYMFFAACEGYFDKMDEQQMMFRRLAEIVHRTNGGKMSGMEMWPLWSDRQIKAKDIASFAETPKEFIERIKKAHKIT